MSKNNKLIIIAGVILLTVLVAFQVISAPPKEITAYQLTVDGKGIFTVEDQTELEKMLVEYKEEYMPREIPEDAQLVKVDFLQQVEVQEVSIKPEEMNTLTDAKDKLYTKKEEATVIEVQPGDVFSTLANKNGITVKEAIKLNPHLNPERIYPGDKVIISPFKPSLDVVCEYEQTTIEPAPFKIIRENDSSMLRSQSKIIKKGIEGEKEVTYTIQAINGFVEKKTVLKEEILKEPVDQVMKVGTKQTVSRGGRIKYGVVNGSRITSSFGSRIHPVTKVRSNHTGVDIGAPHGSTVYAYSEGTVSFAGWKGGYGNIIHIRHGNGMETRYAHLSKINVKVGQKVTAGQAIGRVGSTGTATGPHLHFEVRINGVAKNPLNYI